MKRLKDLLSSMSIGFVMSLAIFILSVAVAGEVVEQINDNKYTVHKKVGINDKYSITLYNSSGDIREIRVVYADFKQISVGDCFSLTNVNRLDTNYKDMRVKYEKRKYVLNIMYNTGVALVFGGLILVKVKYRDRVRDYFSAINDF